ncbi:Nramp family divalent metal transporter [Spelaeicoccus albus]|uniref:Nramp family divalent metal transporter n=1 Tax=Spelaeicoccus albus TaxID=1280376 RepID=UPI001F02F2BF|nr:Nramp family divalent metal transporter [Spelaeicoccus albus]
MRLGVLGPAFIAAVAYVDPGNFATNFSAGARHGYLLLWVIVAANVFGMIVQYLSVKLGTVTGRSLPELIRDTAPPWVTLGMWLQAEFIAIATDLAELIGGALALNMLVGMPMPAGVLAIGAVGLLVLMLSGTGRRRFEYAVIGFLAVILIGLGYGLVSAGMSVPDAAAGLVPRLPDESAVVLSAGILGATLMPHVVYLHSGLPEAATPTEAPETARALRRHRVNVVVAMTAAGVINAAMLLMSAGLRIGGPDAVRAGGEDLGRIFRVIESISGPAAAIAFAVALLASGLASTSVGTFAGQVIMDGFLHRRIHPAILRGVTLVPAMALVVAGMNATDALVLSQVVLSFGIPFAVIPLVWITARRRHMGAYRNAWALTAAAVVIAVGVIALNAYLVATLLD